MGKLDNRAARPKGRSLAALAGLALAGVAAAAMPARAEADRFADLLASVPADIDLWQGGEVYYCDLQTFLPIHPGVVGRLVTLPQDVFSAGVATDFEDEQLLAVAGLPWSALSGLVSFGRMPAEGRVFALDAGAMAAAGPAAALEVAGFARADPDGVPVYWVLADGEMAFELNTVFRSNPLLPDIPVAIRVALLDDRIATARTWPMMEAMLDVRSGTHPALGDEPAVSAALDALEGQGLVVQAVMTARSFTAEEMADAILPDDATQAARREAIDRLGGTVDPRAPYELMLLADLSLPVGDAGALVLVYDSAADAERAAADLQTLWAEGRSLATNQPFAGPLLGGWQIEVVAVGDRHAVRMVIPSPQFTGQPQPMFRHLYQLYVRLDLPIMVAAPRGG
ncbi:MAG: hypothetical protein H6843_12985 [Rhodospirillaceae bacterium]|nr:hypothetical protein [Rhodospirillaceae bacterium]